MYNTAATKNLRKEFPNHVMSLSGVFYCQRLSRDANIRPAGRIPF